MDNLFSKMARAAEARKHDESNRQKKLDEEAKRNLARIIEKKFKTTFIGALSYFEKEFGFLWGQGKPDSELTDSEKKMAKLRQKVRTDVLNNGNNQCRALMNELQQYTVSWDGFNIKIGENDNAS